VKAILTPKRGSILVFLLMLAGLLFEKTYETAVMIMGPILAMWLAIALHEMGHVLFGKLSGFSFVFFVVGPFSIEKTSKGIRVKENKHWLFFGGVAMMTPPAKMKKENILKKWTMFVAGGPFLSLLLAIIGFILFKQFSLEFLLYCSIMNAAILLATIVPFKTSMKTDGYVLLSLLRNNHDSLQLVDELLIMKELISNKKPVEWNPEYIKIAKQKSTSIDHLQFASLIYYYEIEKNGFQAAYNAMADYYAIPVTSKNKFQLGFIIHMQQLYSFLCEEVQLEKILYYQQFLSSLEPVSFYRGKAIIASLQNDQQTAVEYINKVKEIIRENENVYGFYEAEKTLTNLVMEKMMSNDREDVNIG
jgi:hypothetical protein